MSGNKKCRAKKVSHRLAGVDQIIGGPADLPAADLTLLVNVYKKANSNLVLVCEKTIKIKIDSAIKEYKELLRSGAATTSPKVAKFGEKCGKYLM